MNCTKVQTRVLGVINLASKLSACPLKDQILEGLDQVLGLLDNHLSDDLSAFKEGLKSKVPEGIQKGGISSHEDQKTVFLKSSKRQSLAKASSNEPDISLLSPACFHNCKLYLQTSDVYSLLQVNKKGLAEVQDKIFSVQPYALKKLINGIDVIIQAQDNIPQRVREWEEFENAVAKLKAASVNAPRKEAEVKQVLRKWLEKDNCNHGFEAYGWGHPFNKRTCLEVLQSFKINSSQYNRISDNFFVFECTFTLGDRFQLTFDGTICDEAVSELQDGLYLDSFNVKTHDPLDKLNGSRRLFLFEIHTRHRLPLIHTRHDSHPGLAQLDKFRCICVSELLRVIQYELGWDQDEKLWNKIFLHILLIIAMPLEFEVPIELSKDFVESNKILWSDLEEAIWKPIQTYVEGDIDPGLTKFPERDS